MRLSRLTKVAVSAGMILAVVPATASAAPDSEPGTAPDPAPTVAEQAAEVALEAVSEAFDQRGGGQSGNESGDQPGTQSGGQSEGRDVTLLLVDLAQGLDELAPTDRQIAEGYLARPTDGRADDYGDGYQPDAAVETSCAVDVCVTWDDNPGNGDAPPEAGGSGVPAQVSRTHTVLAHVWERLITQGGYRAPLPDAGKAGNAGPNTQFDVYLADIGRGDSGLFGYCAPDTGRRTSSAYCVLDDDYAQGQYPINTPSENLQVTGAHEFFHAVQFAYDLREEWWFLEGTATWVEDEIYDDVNDNRYYLRYSSLHRPESPLDRSTGLWVYGNWIWWRFLTEHPQLSDDASTGLPVLVRNLWNRAGADGGSTQALQALRQELVSQGQRFEPLLAAFGVANRQPGRSYDEGAAYARAPLRTMHTLSSDRRRIAWQSFDLDHLANATVALRPGDGYQQPGWQLRLDLDLPAAAKKPQGRVKVFGTDGSTDVTRIDVAGDGTGSIGLPFSSGTVERIELTLTNAGLENRLPFRYKAATAR